MWYMGLTMSEKLSFCLGKLRSFMCYRNVYISSVADLLHLRDSDLRPRENSPERLGAFRTNGAIHQRSEEKALQNYNIYIYSPFMWIKIIQFNFIYYIEYNKTGYAHTARVGLSTRRRLRDALCLTDSTDLQFIARNGLNFRFFNCSIQIKIGKFPLI